MSNRRHYKGSTPVESRYIRDLARIMENGTGPFSRKYLVEELRKVHKHLSLQEAKNEVSGAIESDKHINKRFKRVIPGGYVLTGANGCGAGGEDEEGLIPVNLQ